jgi:hypothetical protein
MWMEEWRNRLHNASNPDEFRMRCSGIMSSEQAINDADKAPPAVKEEVEDIFVR